jgi:thioredoxin reductase (NADPH)
MANPVILIIDDDQAVLNAVERDVRRRYGRDYRLAKSTSGAAALDQLRKFLRSNEAVALLLSDQRMPDMSGVQFLEQARELFPEARKVLLTAYADTEAAIAAINRVQLDHYLMKPWDPPEEHMYPVLDDLLEAWRASAELPFDGIRVAGTLWSPRSHEVKDFLARHQIAYQWLDVERDAAARALVDSHSNGSLKLPQVFFPDGTHLVDPEIRELAEKTGFQTKASLPFYDLVIVGAGPAGLAAAVYAASEGVHCLVLERQVPGGQAGNSPKIENYLGFPSGVTGMDLSRRAVAQAKRLGAEIISTQAVTGLRLEGPYRVLTLSDGAEVSCKAVLIATGADFRRLDIPGAAELTSAGVYYGAAYTEARNYRDQPVFVVGGANSAGQGALFLSRFASKVTMLIRRDTQWSSKYLVDAEAANPKIERLFNTDVLEVHGKPGCLEEILVQDNLTGEKRTLPGAAMFVFIGAEPQSGLVKELVQCDDNGFILTGRDLMHDGKRPAGWLPARDPFILETSVPGIFAAGDVRHGSNHRVASATGDGGIALAAIQEYINSL